MSINAKVSFLKSLFCKVYIIFVTIEELLMVFMYFACFDIREAARACEEDSSGWASSAFPTNDGRSRSGSRVQSSAKQKSAVSDLTKPSRSKSRKASLDPSEHHQARPLLESMPSLKDLRFDMTSFSTGEFGIDMDSNLPFDLNGESSFETENFEVVPHGYVDGLISGLDDCTEFPEYTDIR